MMLMDHGHLIREKFSIPDHWRASSCQIQWRDQSKMSPWTSSSISTPELLLMERARILCQPGNSFQNGRVVCSKRSQVKLKADTVVIVISTGSGLLFFVRIKSKLSPKNYLFSTVYKQFINICKRLYTLSVCFGPRRKRKANGWSLRTRKLSSGCITCPFKP